jgi:hypothetical protein
MKRITITNKLERALVWFLNGFDEWRLEWCGDKNLCYDAIGKTPKGHKCVIEMKFRKKYYKTKLIEKYKMDELMKLPDDVVKIYFVSDPKGTYYFWLNKLKDMEVINKRCPSTTFWRKHKIEKEVYMLDEDWASIVNKASY